MRFAFIASNRGEFPIAWMCRRLKVSPSGFHRWSKADPPERARRDRELGTMIRAHHVASRGTYGSPRIHRDLKDDGQRVGRKRVARLMREHGLSGRRPRRFRRTTDSNHRSPIAPNMLDREFNPDAPNRVWAADLTYIRTWAGWLYLAVVIDLFSRRVVGWALADNIRTELVLAALGNAYEARRPPPGLIHHSDRGSQYASRKYRRALETMGATCSMSRKGDCWDNAVVESFFGTLKQELLYRGTWSTIAVTNDAIVDYIERFYNVRRRHSTLDYISPLEYELLADRAQPAA